MYCLILFIQLFKITVFFTKLCFLPRLVFLLPNILKVLSNPCSIQLSQTCICFLTIINIFDGCLTNYSACRQMSLHLSNACLLCPPAKSSLAFFYTKFNSSLSFITTCMGTLSASMLLGVWCNAVRKPRSPRTSGRGNSQTRKGGDKK